MAMMATIPRLLCNLELASHSNDSSWAHDANAMLYYAYPVVLTLGIIFGLLNAIVTARMASTSHECCLAAFNVSATLLLVVASMHHLPTYASRKVTSAGTATDGGTYQLTVAPYLPALHSWFHAACTWLLGAAALQRAVRGMSAAAGSRDDSCFPDTSGFGWRLCGILTSCLIFVSALVVALPQFWEFEVSDILVEHATGALLNPHNCTVTGGLARREDSLVTGYVWYDWCFVVASFVLPYTVMPILLPPVACSPHYVHAYSGEGAAAAASRQKVKYRPGSSARNTLLQARDFDRLLTAVVAFYIILSLPANAVHMLTNPPSAGSLNGTGDSINALLGVASELTVSTVSAVLDVTAYSFFSISFFLYLGFSDKYRTSLYGLCCCQKTAQPYYY